MSWRIHFYGIVFNSLVVPVEDSDKRGFLDFQRELLVLLVVILQGLQYLTHSKSGHSAAW